MDIDPHEDCSKDPWVARKDTAIENLKKALEISRKQNSELKDRMQDMRRAVFRPNQVKDDEELALLTNEKYQLEAEVKSLKSKNEQLVNVTNHLSSIVKKTTWTRMTSNADFNQLVQNRIKQCTDILFVKNKEYSSDTDRLHNFKVAGQLLGQHPIAALKGMMIKHEVSIFDIMGSVISGEQPPSPILMDEKFGDIHNYYFLLEALIEEYRDDQS